MTPSHQNVNMGIALYLYKQIDHKSSLNVVGEDTHLVWYMVHHALVTTILQ